MNSKQKGNSFERKISNLLSDRFQEATGLEKAFRRNADSGSFFGRTNQSRIETHGTEHAQFGDIIAPDNFRFTVECKHYKEPPSLNAIIKQDWKQLDEWLEQAQQDGKNAGKDWMVIIKYNRIDEFVVLPETYDVFQPVIYYKGCVFVPLKEFLKGEDSFFFS